MATLNVTDDLRAEHASIKVMLDVIESIVEAADRGREPDATDLGDVVEFLRVFADRCHHAKEEQSLVPEMLEAGVPREGGIVATVMSDHTSARGFIRGLGEAVDALEAGYGGAGAAILNNARGYVSLMREHIEKEEGLLFPMAEQYLRPEQQSRLARAFDRIEEERIGHGKHEELHELLYDLREAYLGAGAGARQR